MPEQVWITRTGAAYHAHKDCECAQEAKGWISVEGSAARVGDI